MRAALLHLGHLSDREKRRVTQNVLLTLVNGLCDNAIFESDEANAPALVFFRLYG